MWKEFLVIITLVLCMVAIGKLGRRRNDGSRSAQLMRKYKTLTPDLLADTPDHELVEAVVAHVLAKATDARKPDPAYTLSKLPQPYMVVYSIWAVCKELARGDYDALAHTATRHVVQDACDGLPVIGAPQTAEELKNLIALHKEGEDTAEAETAFHHAVESECPLALLATYIRDHVPALLGEEIEDESDGE